MLRRLAVRASTRNAWNIHARHFASDESSQQASEIYFTTRDRIEGRKVVEELGVVSATAVRSKNLFNDMYVAVAGLFGGEAASYTALLNETMAEAVSRMQHAAESQGATAVLNVRFDTNTTMNRLVFGLHCSIACYGTAVICQPVSSSTAEGGAVPTTSAPYHQSK